MIWYEPPHDKTNRMILRPAKTQISLGIRPVWSEFSLCVQWVAKDPIVPYADSEDSDQTGRMPRLVWIIAGRLCHFVVFCLFLTWGGWYNQFRRHASRCGVRSVSSTSNNTPTSVFFTPANSRAAVVIPPKLVPAQWSGFTLAPDGARRKALSVVEESVTWPPRMDDRSFRMQRGQNDV